MNRHDLYGDTYDPERDPGNMDDLDGPDVEEYSDEDIGWQAVRRFARAVREERELLAEFPGFSLQQIMRGLRVRACGETEE